MKQLRSQGIYAGCNILNINLSALFIIWKRIKNVNNNRLSYLIKINHFSFFSSMWSFVNSLIISSFSRSFIHEYIHCKDCREKCVLFESDLSIQNVYYLYGIKKTDPFCSISGGSVAHIRTWSEALDHIAVDFYGMMNEQEIIFKIQGIGLLKKSHFLYYTRY